MKRIEDKYQVLSEVKHVLVRPETYVGSVVPLKYSTAIVGEDGKFQESDLEYTPALLKLFDEILSNSVDEHRRHCGTMKNPRLNKIVIDVTETGITISDNGGIPVEFHNEAKMYVPQLIFGQLRSGSNFDDNEQRDVVGRNGLGSSLVNIFSKRFRVVTIDTGGGYFGAVWTNNMQTISEPVIKKLSKYEPGTSIDFDIDFSVFQEKSITFGLLKMMERKAIIAAAGNPRLTIVFNGVEYRFSSLIDYVKQMYNVSGSLIADSNEHWSYVIDTNPTSRLNINFSMVNGTECPHGSHVSRFDHCYRKVILEAMKKTPYEPTYQKIDGMVNAWINVRCINPTFASQTKETLTTAPDNFLQDKTWASFTAATRKKLAVSPVIANLVKFYEEAKAIEDQKKVKSLAKDMANTSKATIRKLIDASSGPKERSKCALWLFEGGSAAASFRACRDPKTQAAYMLKGKVVNTLYMSPLQWSKNEELRDITASIGLRLDKQHDIKKLRYGEICIAADADVDGYSIIGQIITFFVTHFPEVIERGMLKMIQPPLYKCTKGKEKFYFYSQEEYTEFARKNKGYTVAYFKGLGSLEAGDYRVMLRDPRKFTVTMDAETMAYVKGWMGSDSAPRKRFMADEVG